MQEEKILDFLNKNINNCFVDIQEKLISNVNDHITKLINGKELYDYSQLEDIEYNFDDYDESKINISTDQGYQLFMNYIEKNQPRNNYFSVKDFVLEKDEKIVFMWTNFTKEEITTECDNYVCSNYNISEKNTKQIFITNFSKIFYIEKSLDKIKTLQFFEYKFWIPVDYILILRSLVIINYKGSDSDPIYITRYIGGLSKKQLDKKFPNYGTQIDPNTIFSTLEVMKSTLSNRNFLPPFVKDIIEENKRLKEEIERLKLK